MLRLGLCCLFVEAPIRFRITTVRYVASLAKKNISHLSHLGNLVESNLQNLILAIQFCSDHGIGAFRIHSNLMPIATHPEWGYKLKDLPNANQIMLLGQQVKQKALECDIRLTFHPDQFVVLNSPDEKIVDKSIAELEHHGLMAEMLGADVINIHGGGGYGDKKAAINRFSKNFRKLSKDVQKRLTVENDDKIFTPEELLPLCSDIGIPLVYDVHHHRCLSDTLSIEQATEKALETWNREPLFHLSSPKEGWTGPKPHMHHDFINPEDMPEVWAHIPSFTLDVEAKKKEVAVLEFQAALIKKGYQLKGLL